ncbi:MAG: hypothetical protein K8W52_44060 [Deltaproteobacteria bacterium]|nr:hypothetical protein [Deltaproteobacteria bacterium]
MQRRTRTALLAATASLFVATAAHAQPAIQFKSRELQEGRNYTQHLLAVLATGESGGQASYRYDIAVPPAHGITPEVALVYSSGAGQSEIGYGWELTDPTIERSSAHGVPTYSASDTFQYRDGHSTTRLVPTGVIASDGSLEYREESERTSAAISSTSTATPGRSCKPTARAWSSALSPSRAAGRTRRPRPEPPRGPSAASPIRTATRRPTRTSPTASTSTGCAGSGTAATPGRCPP